MPRHSLRERFAAVGRLPEKVRALLGRRGISNWSNLLRALAENTRQVEVGKCHWRERIVRCREPAWWRIMGHRAFTDTIPATTAATAVFDLNSVLKEAALPYHVWRECRPGQPRHAGFRSVAPFLIGLVDIRKPLGRPLGITRREG